MALLTRLFFKKKTAVVYVGETGLFDSGQKTLMRYADFKEIGHWGVCKVDESGKPIETLSTGKMLSETVKFVDCDGKTKLGTDWVADNDRRITGFDP